MENGHDGECILPAAADDGIPAEESSTQVSRGLISDISLPETIIISVRDTKTLPLNMTPNLADPKCEWASTDPDIVTVCGIEGGAAGIITGVSVGSTTITVRTEDGLEATCVVTVQDAPTPTGLKLEESYTVQVGRVVYIHPKIEPEGATALFSITTQDSDKLDVATVQSGSYVAIRGLKSGISKISVDVGNGIRAESEVRIKENGIDSSWAKEYGLLAYVSPDNMSDSLTRADLAGFAAAFAGLELNYADALSYTDCNTLTDIQRAAIEKTTSAGLMGGTSSSTFSPHTAITRAQLATIIWRCLGTPETDYAFCFGDVPYYTWYYEPITALHNLGIIAVTGDLIEPNATVTFEEALSWFAAARAYEIETEMYQVTTDLLLSPDTVKYIFWDSPDNEQTYVKMQFSPITTGWYEVISSGSKAKIDFYETENIEVVTDSWTSEYGPFGTYIMKAQLYQGETYTISVYPHYFGEGGLALSVRGPQENLPIASMSFETDEKQLYVGEKWTPEIQISPAEVSVQDTNWWCTDYSVVQQIRGEDGERNTLLAVGEGTATVTITSYLTEDDGTYCGYIKASCKIVVTEKTPEPQPELPTGSESSSSSSNTTTTTTKNDDGSTTTTVTNKTTGTVTETTKNTDGSTLVVVTEKDGTVTTTETTVDKVVVKTVDDPGEDVTATVTIPRSVGTATVTIPADATPGTVAVDAYTGEIVKLSVPTEDGLTVKLDGSADLVLVDMSKDFTDTDNHWAEDAIDFATAHGMFSGTSATTFSPDGTMTRGMIAVVLHNFDNNPEHAFEGSFDDVPPDSWHADGIHWMVDSGIAGGYGNGRFGANDSITREQLATFLYNFAKVKGYDVSGRADLSRFTDGSSVSGYATETMSWAVGNGLIGGMGDGTLAPQANATRAQVATILMRFVENLTK